MAYPSTLLDIQIDVLQRLRLESPDAIGSIKDWINQAYARVCVETEALQQTGLGTLTAGDGTYVLPAQVIRLKQITTSATDTFAGPPLQEVSLDEILRLRQSGGTTALTTGSCRFYALVGTQQLELYPAPSGADQIAITYSYVPTPLSSPSDRPQLPEPYATECLRYGALMEAADFYGLQKEAEYRQLYDQWTNRLRIQVNRMGSGGSYQIPVQRRFLAPHNPSTDVRYGYSN